MSLETSDQAGETSDALEAFKDKIKAPFAVVDKGVEPPLYSFKFSKNVRSNWTEICKLMDWNGEAQEVPDYNYFRVAENPVDLVKQIQEKILQEGGGLPRFGTDGLFGPETQEALRSVITSQSGVAVDSAPIEEAPVLSSGALTTREGKREIRDPMEVLMQERLGEMVEVLPRIETRLNAAGLDLDSDFLRSSSFSTAEVASYQSRAMEFRESMVLEEPRLKPLNEAANVLIPVLEVEIKKIDLSKIHSMEDLMVTIEQFIKSLESKLKTELVSLSDTLNEEEMNALIRDGDLEVVMSFFMAVFQEFAVIMAGYFKENEQNFERIVKIFEDEYLVQIRPKLDEALSDVRVREIVPESNTYPSWEDLVEAGEQVSGHFQFENPTDQLSFDLTSGELWVNGTVARLNLPEPATLYSLRANKDGSLTIKADLGLTMIEQQVSKEDLADLFTKLNSASVGESVNLSRGVSFSILNPLNSASQSLA